MFGFIVCYIFFFKQKTAYEMRISDWSSDVCSSDLLIFARERIDIARDMRRFVGGDRDERRETFERIVVVRWKGLFEEVDPQFGEQRPQALDIGDSPAFIGVDDPVRPGLRRAHGANLGLGG